ncbi:hypothetical protein N9730_00600 [Gammaproteobacteria bacterium]|nr:hypothetical protein [Gammaproteobacteria bacterium]
MKHIKIWITLLLINFSLIIQGDTNPILISYFGKVFEDEKSKFLQCVASENLIPEDQIYTDCKISELAKDSAYILYSNKELDSADLLDEFKRFKSKKKTSLQYPRSMLAKEEMGRVIVEFDINQLGATENHEIQKGLCGNLYDPQTELKPCKGFNTSSLQAAKKLKYLPTSFKEMPITHKRVKHSFTFIMEQNPTVQISKGARSYNKLLAAMKKNDFKTALIIANKNIENDSYFIFQKAAIKFSQKNYTESLELLEKFQLSTINQDKEIIEQYYVISFSMQVDALFNLGRYQEIIDLEKNYKIYSSDRQKYKNLLSMTNFYMGAAYINTGNIPKGAYYMTLASRNAVSKGQSDYFDSFIDQISSYL